MFAEETIAHQPSWVLESDCVRMAVTQAGAHLAPVYFFSNEASPVQPYHISPRQGEIPGLAESCSEAVLRGDFFCLPFGRAESARDSLYSHGRTAGYPWRLVGALSAGGLHTLQIAMDEALRSAQVTREFFLRDGENVIYDRTSVRGLEGAFPIGHHAVLRTPEGNARLLLSTAKIQFGMTYPGAFAQPEAGEHQALAIGAHLKSLAAVPSLGGSEVVDCSAYPARCGCSDLLQVAVDPDPGQPAWSVAVSPEERYLWFSLRDARMLPSTIVWMENCGRQSAPWNGRTRLLGIEDVCSYFDCGITASRLPNVFSQHGVATVHQFQSHPICRISYVQGVMRIPQGFGRVQRVVCHSSRASFFDVQGRTAEAKVQTSFLYGEDLVS